MPDPKPLSIRLSRDLLERIDDYCAENEVARSSFIRSAVVAYLENIDQPLKVATIDHQARSAVDALNQRLMAVEEKLEGLQEKKISQSMF